MNINHSAPIFIVDDEPAILTLVKQIVGSIGFEEVHHALDCERALSMLRGNKYQLVICDLYMQPINEPGLLRSIREDDSLQRTPFILMTVSGHPGIALAAKKAGADGVLLKPFTPQQLRVKVHEVSLKR